MLTVELLDHDEDRECELFVVDLELVERRGHRPATLVTIPVDKWLSLRVIAPMLRRRQDTTIVGHDNVTRLHEFICRPEGPGVRENHALRERHLVDDVTTVVDGGSLDDLRVHDDHSSPRL
jgi:hypothetical protein